MANNNNSIETDKSFLRASMKERILFDFFNKQKADFRIIKFSKFDNKKAKWDVSIYSAGTYYIGEIKCRTYSSYDFDSWILEQDKWNDLEEVRQKYPQDCNVKIIYINIFPDDQLAIWQLDEIDPKTLVLKERTGRRKTCGNSNKISIHKEYHLPSSLATFFRFEIPSFYDIQAKIQKYLA